MHKLFILLSLVGALALPAAAAEGLPDGASGAYLSSISGGQLTLGERILQPGDVLTAEQAAQMVFAGAPGQAEVLPIFPEGVEEAMTLSLRGKKDQAPIAEDSAIETYKNLENTGKFKTSDPENQALAFTITRQPKRGTLTVHDDGSYTYTPKKNKVGIDSFTYTATDPAGNVSREATVTVTILKPTEAPQYTDTIGEDCRFAAEWMKHTGIFVGETVAETTCFGADKEVTQGEFLSMVVKALDIPAEEDHAAQIDADVPQWLRPYFAAALRSGLEAALTDTPNEIITGPEAEAILTAALGEDFPLECGGNLTRGQAAQALYAASRIHQGQTLGTEQ